MTNAAQTEADKKAREKAMNAAYGAATKTLREKYKPEFNELYQAEAKARGYDWTPPQTETEKAKAQLDALLKAHPELIPTITPTENQTPPAAPAKDSPSE